MILKAKKLKPDAILPNSAYKGDAGLDLYSAENKLIRSQEREIIETGIAIEIPENFVGLIWDRSSLGAKFGLTTLAGVIDSGYRGEIRVVLYNTSETTYQVRKNDKIAQLLIQAIEPVKILEVRQLNNSQRGEKTFGSSDKI